MFHLVCYLRDGDRVFETYWTTRRGVEAMDYSLALMDLTPYGRQEPWEDSPAGWPQPWQVDGSNLRIDGRPIGQWPRLAAGHADHLTQKEQLMDTTALRAAYDTLLEVATAPDFGATAEGDGTPTTSWPI